MNGDKGMLLAKRLLALLLFSLFSLWGTSIFFPRPFLGFLATPTSRQAFYGALVGLAVGPLLVLRGRVRIVEINRSPLLVVAQADAGARFTNLLVWLKVIALGAVLTYLVIHWLPGDRRGVAIAEVAMTLTLLLAGWQIYPSRHDIELPIISYVSPPGRPTPPPPPPFAKASGGRPPDEPPQAA